MDILKIELGKSIIVILFIILFSCNENKIAQEKDNNDKISIKILSIEKKKNIYNILISVDNENTDKYVMIYDYHGFEIKENYPKKIKKNTEIIIDYNFFLRDNINDRKDSIVNDPAIENTSESFTLLILPKGKTNVTLKNISLPNLNTNKKYLYLYFSKMEEETFEALPKGTRKYDIIADEKGFRNYKFSKKIIPF